MKKWIAVGIIILAVIGYATIGDPIEPSDNEKSITKKVANNKAVKILEEPTKDVTNQLGELSIDNNCSDPNSRNCSITKSYVFNVGLAVTVFFAMLGILGLIGLFRYISSKIS